MSADTKPSKAPCLGLLWTPLQLACSLATWRLLDGTLKSGDTFQMPWGQEGQELSMVRA